MYRESYNKRMMLLAVIILITLLYIGRVKITEHIIKVFNDEHHIAYGLDTLKPISYIIPSEIISDTTRNIISNKPVIKSIKDKDIIISSSNPTIIKTVIEDTIKPVINTDNKLIENNDTEEIVEEKVVYKKTLDSVKYNIKTEPIKKKRSIFKIFKRGV